MSVSDNPGDNGAVAVDEAPAEVVPDEAPVLSEGVYYLESGKVRIVADGAPYTLRNPRIGEFRRLHELWVEGSKLPANEQLDHQLAWVKLLFNGDPEADPPLRGLSDHPIAEDPNEWPTWLGVATYQAKVMVHFRDVPLALGARTAAS